MLTILALVSVTHSISFSFYLGCFWSCLLASVCPKKLFAKESLPIF